MIKSFSNFVLILICCSGCQLTSYYFFLPDDENLDDVLEEVIKKNYGIEASE